MVLQIFFFFFFGGGGQSKQIALWSMWKWWKDERLIKWDPCDLPAQADQYNREYYKKRCSKDYQINVSTQKVICSPDFLANVVDDFSS